MSPSINPIQDKLANIKNPKKPFKIKLGVVPKEEEHGRGKTKKEVSSQYKIGESVRIQFESDEDCYLTLIDLGTSGRVHIIVPNSMNVDNFVKAGRPLYYPGESWNVACIIQGPTGTERIKAFATLDPINLFDINLKDLSSLFFTISEDRLELKVENVKKKLKELDSSRWCEALCEFKITKPVDYM